ncbi:MAG: substrate-binding domain-containing protein [Ignisphaera sp.]
MEYRYIIVLGIALLSVSAIILYATYPTRPIIRVRIATTTSLYATGLLEYISSRFTEVHRDIELQFIAVGSGAALRYAERGDVCAILIHEPGLEKLYIERGAIEGQRILAYSFFVIVGPENDPANVSSALDVVDAFRRVYRVAEEGLIRFISRADNSGTHNREMKIWNLIGVSPRDKPWYIECGCGMDQALIMASEFKGYTLSDVGTYTVLKAKGRIQNVKILYGNASDDLMLNIYSGYLASGCRGTERMYAELFLDFIYSNPDIVNSFGVEEYGVRLFYHSRHYEGSILDAWNRLALSG